MALLMTLIIGGACQAASEKSSSGKHTQVKEESTQKAGQLTTITGDYFPSKGANFVVEDVLVQYRGDHGAKGHHDKYAGKKVSVTGYVFENDCKDKMGQCWGGDWIMKDVQEIRIVE